MNILVTSAGGPAAIGVIKSLRQFDTEKKHKIIATDITDLSVGLHLADDGYIVPKANKDYFTQAIAKIVKEAEIDVILPTGNLEIDQFQELSHMTNIFMSDSKTIKLCNDRDCKPSPLGFLILEYSLKHLFKSVPYFSSKVSSTLQSSRLAFIPCP